MIGKRDFDIAFVGLKPGEHVFTYELDEEFFKENGAEDFTNASANVKLTLEKNSGFILLKFEVGGKAEVSCDRCGNPLTINLWDEFKMLVKMVDNPDVMNEQEEDPDVYYISRTESHLHVKNWLYEFVILSLPLQRMCPPDGEGNPQCNVEVIAKLKEMEGRVIEHNSDNLWKGLEKFKNKN